MQKYRYTPYKINHGDFSSRFDGNTGVYVRSNDRNGKDPFMAEFPELIDVGIMETCVCSRHCQVDCYQRAIARTGNNMSLEAYKRMIEECEGKVFQVALGGAGDPDTHESFAEILKVSAEHNIVPNFTTSGILMTAEKAKLCYIYCGAVAVSEHFAEYTDRAVKLLLEAGVKTNIHYVLSRETIDKAIAILEGEPYREGINAIVFLLYKPVGLGSSEKVLQPEDARLQRFFYLVNHNACRFKIGFDSCSCPGLINYGEGIDFSMMDYCEGGRYSMYISADLKAYPCSFANQTDMGFDLTGHTIKEAWDSFDYFREKLLKGCPRCDHREFCMGGCPLMESIVLCNRPEKSREKGLIRYP